MPNETSHWRPSLHFTPRQNWINDPNGLIWHAGEYHLFYQYNPQGDSWGHMSWGHAVSTDMIHWQELPVALPETEDWMIFSGSVVVDHAHTAGFGDGAQPAMVAIFTGSAQRPDEHGIYRQNQHLAWSVDKGRTWQHHAGNPVLDLGRGAFRDPKVLWHADSARWVMLVSLAEDGALLFFTSHDLKTWQAASRWSVDLPPACRLWECPDLIRLPAQDGPAHWLLKWDVFEGHPGGGSGALAVVGEFDGTSFRASQAPQWLDGGMDFYAAQSFNAMPPGDGRCVWLAWMSAHGYAKDTPTFPWRGAMTLPREVSLVQTHTGWRVAQQPVRERLSRCADLQEWTFDVAPSVEALSLSDEIFQSASAIELWVEVGCAEEGSWAFGLHHRPAPGADQPPVQATWVGVDAAQRRVFIDRCLSGPGPQAQGFRGIRYQPLHEPPQPPTRQPTQLRIIVDACSIELFSADGLTVLSEAVFPAEGTSGLCFKSSTAAQVRVKAWRLDA